MAIRRRRPLLWVAIALVALTLAWFQLEFVEFAEDDAFIHLRIGRNFVETGLPYFNVDEPVKGSSSTVWLLIVSALTAATGEPVLAVALLNLALVFTACWLATTLQARLLPGSGAWSRIAVAVGTLAILWPTARGLMESVLAVVLLLGAYLALIQGSRAAWVLLGVAVATRPEFVLAVPPVVWFWARSEPRSVQAWLEALVFGMAGTVPFVIFDLVAYGTVIPHAVVAKRLMYDLDLGQSLTSLFPMIGSWGVVTILAGALGLGFASQKPALRSASIANALIASGALVAVAYAATRTLAFSWYQPLWLAPLFLGVVWKGLVLDPRIARWSGLIIGLPAIAYCSVLVLALSGQIQAPIASFQARTPMYQAIGDALSESCEGCTLASSEIGGLAYAFTGKVLDAGGLTDPVALRHHPLPFPSQRRTGGLGAIPLGYVIEMEPDLIVSYEPLLERSMLDSMEGYEVLECPPILPKHEAMGFPASVMGSEHLYVFLGEKLGPTIISEIRALFLTVGGCIRYPQAV